MNRSDHTCRKRKRTKQTTVTNNKMKKKKVANPFYARLMRHDWHIKVNGRIRQRGWNDDQQ